MEKPIGKTEKPGFGKGFPHSSRFASSFASSCSISWVVDLVDIISRLWYRKAPGSKSFQVRLMGVAKISKEQCCNVLQH